MINPILVALDVPTPELAMSLVENLRELVGGFKIGSELFTTDGPEMVRSIRAGGSHVFLDLKFHDIPNTVAKAVAAAVRLDVQMLTVHTCGGLEMLKAAQKASEDTARQAMRNPPLILGVTVLTSMDTNQIQSVGISDSVGKQVERLAQLAVLSGIGGIVCSPLEIVQLRQTIPSAMQLVTPGIRGAEDEKGDQKRTLSAAEALSAGANWLVIGRPIYAAPDPVAAATKILDSLKQS